MSDHFPCEIGLNDGSRVLLRRLTPSDSHALYDFFQRLPEGLRRLAWDDLDDRETVESWATRTDLERTLPLVAVEGSKIVAETTLFYRERGPLRLVGRVQWFIDAELRGRGLAAHLASQLIAVGRDNGLSHLSCMLSTRYEERDIQALESRGFKATQFPQYGADPDGAPEDLTYLVCKL